jgi:hypothetical protein
MTNPLDVEKLLRDADEYLASPRHRPTRMVRKLREALAAELAASTEAQQVLRRAQKQIIRDNTRLQNVVNAACE